MLVTFTTNERILETQNRGFFAIWEFSESFVKLGTYDMFSVRNIINQFVFIVFLNTLQSVNETLILG
jgi:hypothetical protein